MARSTTFKYTVTVSNPGSGNKYYIDGNLQQYVILFPGCTYEFNQDDSSNSTHPLRFSETSDGTHNSGSEYTTGVTTSGTPGSATAFTKIEVTSSTPYRLYYYCSSHSGMGGAVDIPTSFSGLSGRTIMFQGGSTPTPYNHKSEYFNINTTGNAAEFGDCTANTNQNNGVTGNRTKAISGGGAGNPAAQTHIEYVVSATLGNAGDFGDLSEARTDPSGLSNTVKGIFSGGSDNGGTPVNTMDEVLFESAGTAIDFGDLSVARTVSAAVSTSTRGVVLGGLTPSAQDVIDYITINSRSNATDFGNLTNARGPSRTGANSTTRGLAQGGHNPSYVDIIDYITIASTGNATDFGDLIEDTGKAMGASTNVRAVCFGGQCPNASPVENPTNRMQYVTIASTGNATDFGDLVRVTKYGGGASDAQGGLQ